MKILGWIMIVAPIYFILIGISPFLISWDEIAKLGDLKFNLLALGITLLITGWFGFAGWLIWR